MCNYGSDKGSGHHNYADTYQELFKHLVGKPNVKLFEMGIGTTDISIPSNMGPEGRPGASLRGWRDWLETANIYGADVDRKVLFTEDKIRTYFVDQRSASSIQNMWSKIDETFDIIIDDGLHELDANFTFVENSHHKLKPGGYYIVEDVMWPHLHKEQIEKFISECSIWFSKVEFREIPNPGNTNDNNIFIMIK
jgi:SAM-dependent methyltransferase